MAAILKKSMEKPQFERYCWTVWCKDDRPSKWETPISDHCSSKTSWPILMKFVNSDYTHAKLRFQGSNGSVPHSGEINTQVAIFLLSIYIFMFLLTCTGRTVDRKNIVNGSQYVFSRKVGPLWG